MLPCHAHPALGTTARERVCPEAAADVAAEAAAGPALAPAPAPAPAAPAPAGHSAACNWNFTASF